MNWQNLLKENITTVEQLAEVVPLSAEEEARIRDEIGRFPMSVPRYYLSLVNPDDPDDPIRKMALPSGRAALDGDLDTSGEHANTKIRGLQHKYERTVLILTTSSCAMYCRFCFRRRMVGTGDVEIAVDPAPAGEYIKAHPEVNNVLLSGGDSFLMPTEKIEEWLWRLASLRQLDFIRFGTRTPVTFPQRIILDPGLREAIARYSAVKQIYIVTHFNHPAEITTESTEAVRLLQNAGAVVKNQTVLMRGVNNDPEVLARLLGKLTSIGVVPHYIFQCRPVRGVKSWFQIPLREGSSIVAEALARQNGLGKCADYTMSHVTGKIRILGPAPGGGMLFQYKQAKDPEDSGKIFEADVADGQAWLPDEVPGQAMGKGRG